jgi:hypothetical protein
VGVRRGGRPSVDARIEGLIAVIGIALLVFGLIEAKLRAALGEGAVLPSSASRPVRRRVAGARGGARG